MFNKTANIKKLLKEGVNVCIGTDSPMSGGTNILSEMKYDRKLYKELYNDDLPDESIVKMVTSNPARAFKLHNLGQISPGYLADLVVFADKGENPYDSIISAELRDILLVVIDGVPTYGSVEYKGIFDALKIKYQQICIDGVEKIIAGDLIGLMKRINRAVGFNKKFPFLPVEF